MTIDSSGNLFVADTFNNRIREISPSGAISTIAGNGEDEFAGDNGPASIAGLATPKSVTLDGLGNLYIADTDNNCIRRITAGIITTVAGNVQAPGFGGTEERQPRHP